MELASHKLKGDQLYLVVSNKLSNKGEVLFLEEPNQPNQLEAVLYLELNSLSNNNSKEEVLCLVNNLPRLPCLEQLNHNNSSNNNQEQQDHFLEPLLLHRIMVNHNNNQPYLELSQLNQLQVP